MIPPRWAAWWGVLAVVAFLGVACGSGKTPKLSVPTIPLLTSKSEAGAPVRAKRMEFDRFEVDWDGVTPLASRPKDEVRGKLLTSIERECPGYQLVNEGEQTEETSVQTASGVQQNAKIYRKYYWVRYRCQAVTETD